MRLYIVCSVIVLPWAKSCLVVDQVNRVSQRDGMASGGAGTSNALDGRPEEGEGDATTQPAEG